MRVVRSSVLAAIVAAFLSVGVLVEVPDTDGDGTADERDNCVEVAFISGAIAVRDSKNPTGPALVFTPGEWDAFVGGAKDGEFDLD